MKWNHLVRCRSANLGIFLIFIMILTVAIPSIASSNRQTLLLSGRDWWIHDDSNSTGESNGFISADMPSMGWIPAQVPGNIQADLEAAHVLPPLWYGAINPKLYDVARKDWWYRKDFTVPASFAKQRLTLVFDGVDERCQIWLNGKKIGANAGMFRRFSFDVSDYIQPGAVNHLSLKIARMPEELLPYLVNSDGPDTPFAKYWFLNGINKTREVLKDLKTPGNFSYDWATNVWTLGIWRNVRIETTGPARIDWTRVSTSLNNDFSKAVVTAALEVNSLEAKPIQAKFFIDGHGPAVSKKIDVLLTKGHNIISVQLPINNPALWWPNGHGAQPLYTLHAELKTSDGSISDTYSTRFGIRDIKWVYTEGAPKDFISRYQLVINGREVRTMGSGIIYPYIMPGLGLEHELQLLYHAKDAGMNFLRINGGGGGALFDEPWFDLADELGIMISHEFPLGNCSPEKDAEFLGNLEITLLSMIKTYRNHPSIIEFAGGNEMTWDSNTKHPALQLMQKLAAQETDQIFRATCPDAGAKHCPWDFDMNSTSGTGKIYGPTGNSYRNYNTVDNVMTGDFGILPSTANPAIDTMRYGEFGTSSPSHEEVWYRDIPLKSQWPLTDVNDPVMIHKNTLNAVFSPYHWLLKPRIDWAFGSPDNLHDLILAGQYLGADPLRYIYDELRRRGKRMGGFTNHCYSEPWPNTAGSYMVDYDGRTLINYDFLKQALAPISLSLRYNSVFYSPQDGIKAVLFLVSDAPSEVSGLKWKWVARDITGKIFSQANGTANISPLEVKSLMPIELHPAPEMNHSPVFVELYLDDSKGKLLTERIQIFGPTGNGPFAALLNSKHSTNSVRRTALTVTEKSVRYDEKDEVLELLVKNTGSMTALFCEPHPLLVYRTDLRITNNNCFIPPNESRIIAIRALKGSKNGLSLKQTGWKLTCWNADDMMISPSDDVLLSFGRQDKTCREYLGYFDVSLIKDDEKTTIIGNRPDASKIPYRLSDSESVNFEFACNSAQAAKPAKLCIKTSDQSSDVPAVITVIVNGRTMETKLPIGLGIQSTDPSHLAFPAEVVFEIASKDLHKGNNSISIKVSKGGWFSWDALQLVSKTK